MRNTYTCMSKTQYKLCHAVQKRRVLRKKTMRLGIKTQQDNEKCTAKKIKNLHPVRVVT